MSNYAMYESDTIINIIVAESKDLAESITGLKAIEIIDNRPLMGWELFEGVWRSQKPFDSWTWNGEDWEAPIPMPNDGNKYFWDEQSLSWIQVIPSEENNVGENN